MFLKYEYQLTEDGVHMVFSRYGRVSKVDVNREGTTALVTFEQPHQAVAAQHVFDRMLVPWLPGAYWRVEFHGRVV